MRKKTFAQIANQLSEEQKQSILRRSFKIIEGLEEKEKTITKHRWAIAIFSLIALLIFIMQQNRETQLFVIGSAAIGEGLALLAYIIDQAKKNKSLI